MNRYSESYAVKSTHTDISLLRRIAKKIQKPRDQIIFNLILETGCSAKELIGLKPEQIEFTTCSIRLGHKQRRVKLPLELSLQLSSFLRPGEEYVFKTRQGNNITNRRVQQIVSENTLDLLGKKLTVREIRSNNLHLRLARTKSIKKTIIETGIKTLRSKTFLTNEQLMLIQSHISDNQHRLIFDILCETGCRLKELVSIKVRDVNRQDNSIIIRAENTREKKQRTSRISKGLGHLIESFVKDNGLAAEDFLFSSRQSGNISDKRVFQLIREYGRLAGLANVSPQIIRNSHIINAIRSSSKESDITEQTGVKHLDIHHYGFGKAKARDKTQYEHKKQ